MMIILETRTRTRTKTTGHNNDDNDADDDSLLKVMVMDDSYMAYIFTKKKIRTHTPYISLTVHTFRERNIAHFAMYVDSPSILSAPGVISQNHSMQQTLP